MRVLFATSECHPFVKTGGLGDVAGALPGALHEVGIDVRILLPAYRQVTASVGAVREVARIPAAFAYPEARVLEAADRLNGAVVWLVDAPVLYDRDGGPYVDPLGQDWDDNHLRFGLLSHAAFVLAGAQSPLPWRPDVLHCHDWQTGLAPAYVSLARDRRVATVTTIHNLAFQGLFAPDTMGQLGLPAHAYAIDGLEFFGRVSFLKAGLYYSDRLTTVSPTYAREIQGEALGFGMNGLLAHRSNVLSGITNGIDTVEWDPARDRHLARRYDAGRLDAKRDNRVELLKRFGLPDSRHVPLIGTVGRMTYQKGADLVPDALRRHLPDGIRFVALGTGERTAEDALRALAAEFPEAVAVKVGYDEALAHLVEAGADIFLMPSRFEPCGLNQMYSQRYGTPPLVRATGGLVDTVSDPGDAFERVDTATGIVFGDATVDALSGAIGRAVSAWTDVGVWRKLQTNGMARDFSWRQSALRYARLYESLVPGAH